MYIRRSRNVQGVFWTSYVHLVYVPYPGVILLSLLMNLNSYLSFTFSLVQVDLSGYTPIPVKDGAVCKNSQRLSVITYSRKTLHLRCWQGSEYAFCLWWHYLPSMPPNSSEISSWVNFTPGHELWNAIFSFAPK